jgi:hypothetical protein
MTILSTEILPLTLMLFRLARHPRRRSCFDGAPSRRAVPALGIKLDVLTKGKQAAVITRFPRALVGLALACARRPIIWKVKMAERACWLHDGESQLGPFYRRCGALITPCFGGNLSTFMSN